MRYALDWRCPTPLTAALVMGTLSTLKKCSSFQLLEEMVKDTSPCFGDMIVT